MQDRNVAWVERQRNPGFASLNPGYIIRSLLYWLNGDAAYERYLAHWQRHHAGDGAPLDRKAFFKAEQERKWNGVRRCC